MRIAQRSTFTLTALCVALGAAWGEARAQQEDAEVAALTRPQSEVSVGAGYWNKDRPRLGTYDGMSEKGAYGLLDAYINRRDEATGTWFTLDARNLGLETRELRADWLRQGDYGVFFEYGRTPRDEPYSIFTGVSGIGTTTLRVPTPSAAALGEVRFGTVRDAFGAGFSKILGGGYDFRVTARTEEKEGARLWGRGGAAEFAAEPINSTTRQLEAVVSRTTKTLQLHGGYYGSFYTNSNSIVDTALSNGTNPFFLSLPLDNQAHQLYLNGGYSFNERTRGTFKVAYTRATQDEQIPVGPGVATFAGAPTHLNGRVDTTLMQLGVSQRMSSEFSWVASLRNYDMNDKTPTQRVVQTGAPCPTCVDTTPISVNTLTGKVEGTWRAGKGVSLLGGVDIATQDRTIPVGNFDATGVDEQRYVPWRNKLDETTLRLEARRSLADTLNGRIAYAHSKRDGSNFTATNESQSDMINPINIADRTRDKLKLMLDWAPLEALTLTFNVEYAKDDYGFSDARPFGLRDGTASLFSLDAAYSINDNWQVTGFYTRDNATATQIGQRSPNGGAIDTLKSAELEDTGDTLGVGLRGALAPKVKAGLDVLYSKNVNRYPETVTALGASTPYAAGTVGPLPDITNTLKRLNLYAIYAMRKNSELRFEYTHELWKAQDWSWMFSDGTPYTYGSTTDGTQVAQPAKQSADWFGVRYIYRFQ
jgi:MtrB/PioB family decaheme-associated outer membrane protein